MKAAHHPSDLELQILALLWERGPMTARQVLEALPDGKPRAYTSVLSVIQVMEKKGFLKHASDGNTHIYRPCVAREPIVGSHLARLVKLVFAGRPSAAIQTLLSQTSTEELAEVRRLMNDKASTRTARKKS
jgi:BlaI family transcriptional regulator, penicillinase repressor